ncbi:MAG TPA: hypothetical protein VFG10_00720 [Saprospiraceae bacterium]|nr:hypothetical protein [Saprospiraceae bacterium]
MTRFLFSLTGLTFLSAILILTSCNQQSDWEIESAQLLRKSNELDLKHLQLNRRIDSLWDATSISLNEALPDDFPSIDRNIFLKARNADHIRMFMSYKLLDEKAKALVNKAGEYDEMLAVQVRNLFAQQHDFEEQKINFLSKVEHKDQRASRLYAERFQTSTED